VSPEAAKALQNGGGEPKPTHPLPRKRHFEEAIRKNHDFFRGLFSRAKKTVNKGVLTPEASKPNGRSIYEIGFSDTHTKMRWFGERKRG